MGEKALTAGNLTQDSLYRVLVESISDYAIYMIGADGIIISWNAGAQRFTGYKAAEVIGQHFSLFYDEDDRRQRLPEVALETSARDGAFECEGWRVRKDGSRFWAHVVVDPIRDESGRLLGFAKITRDLSERKSTRAALRRSEDQFRVLVQGVTDYAIYLLDDTGIVSSWNSGAQRIKGYLPQEVVGRHFSLFYTAEDQAREEPRKALETAVREGRFEKEGWRVRKDGAFFRAHVIIDPIRDDGGSVIGFAKVTRDMTEYKNSQLALERAREALFQSQKMEAVGQLTGGIAHDFNNILMAVLGGLELISRRLPEDPNITPLLNNAIQAAQRGKSLTQRMLAFARRQTLKPESVDLPALVHGMTDMMQRSIGPSVAIETSFPAGLGPVLVDPHQMELAILNLVMNARDAMPDGGAVLLAAREDVSIPDSDALSPSGRYVCVSVTDWGNGMDEVTLSRAMEPFFTTKGVGKGTGLGLSMVHGLAEQSGGQLILSSRKNEGTTAHFWLPGAVSGRSSDAVPEQRTGLVVLVVADDEGDRDRTIEFLKGLGHAVRQAGSVDDALAVIRLDPAIDLIVTDHAIGRTGGLRFAEAIRTERPSLPMIYATPLADPRVVKMAKPFRRDELVRAIQAAKRVGRNHIARGRHCIHDPV